MARRRRRDPPRCSECGERITWALDTDEHVWRPLDLYLEHGRGRLYALTGRTCYLLRQTDTGHADHRDRCTARTDRPNPPHPAVTD